jgi:hypothetical protein
MRLDHARFADVVVLSPRGRVDHATAEALKTALAPHLARCAKGQDHVVLDLAGLNPFARIEPPDPHASVERRDVGRLGVFLITQLADRFDYARAGERNRVTVELPATKSA